MQDISPRLAELYDIDCGDFAEDFAFYKSLASAAGRPVLELGVGTGRVATAIAVALAEGGADIWGIDASPAMLERAKCNVDERNVTVRLVHTRMEAFDLEERFGLIYAAFGTMHHLLTTEALGSCFRCVARHLAPGGTFAFDMRPLHFEDWEEGESVPLFHDWTRSHPRTGEMVMKFRMVRNDAEGRVKHETALFDTIGRDGTFRRDVLETSLRYFDRDEIDQAATRAGLRLDGVYGGYDKEPYAEGGDHMVVIARTLEGVA